MKHLVFVAVVIIFAIIALKVLFWAAKSVIVFVVIAGGLYLLYRSSFVQRFLGRR